jgi:hypothetical protein
MRYESLQFKTDHFFLYCYPGYHHMGLCWLFSPLLLLKMNNQAQRILQTGRTTMHFGEYILLATGRTTMHVGNIICTNTTDETVLFTLEPGLLISTTDKQPLVIPHPITVSIPPNSKVTHPITNGICVDITKPAPGKERH